jgi:membrane fusion protein, multidrug efflux system
MKTSLLLTTLTIIAAASGCTKDYAAHAATVPEAVSVRISPVSKTEAAPAVRAAGILGGKQELKLSFKVGGLVGHLFVEEGQTIRKGQLLAALDKTEIEAEVSKAERAYEKALRDLERAKVLHAKNVATLEQLQDATTGHDMTKSALEAARFNLQHSSIVAPENGRVLKRFVEDGEMVGPGTPIFAFSSTAKGWVVRAGLSERDVVRVRIGDRGSVRFGAYPNDSFSAEVSEIAAVAAPMTGTFEVELRIDPKGAKLLSGMSAKVEIEPAAKEQVYLVPIEALIEGDGDRGQVYAVDDSSGLAKRREVLLAFIEGDMVAVKDGLEGVSSVVTDGATNLEDAARIRIIP